jgi:hypothetical protein
VSSRAWAELRVTSERAAADAVTQALLDSGAGGVVEELRGNGRPPTPTPIA